MSDNVVNTVERGPPMSDTGQPPARGGDGRFLRTVHTVARDAQAAELRAEGATFQQIADQLGYCDKGEAWRAVQRTLALTVKEPAERLRAVEAAKLDELYVEALEVLEREHLMVSHGRIVKDDNGQPLTDDGPKLAAIDRLTKVRESYRKLFGLDAPSRVSVDADHLGAEIMQMLERTDDSGGGDDDGT